MVKRAALSAIIIGFIVSSCATARAADMSITGDVEISKSSRLSQAGKAITFPDGTRQTTAPFEYSKTIVVSPRGTEVENGNALLDAIGAITDASAANRYLIRLEPGVYNISDTSLSMKSYIDIEGSGEDATAIKGNINSPIAGVVTGADYCEIRSMTIEHTGGAFFAAALFNNSASPHLTRLTVRVVSAENAVGIYNKDSRPQISHVKVETSGTGDSASAIFSDTGSIPSLKYVWARASGAQKNTGIKIQGPSSAQMMNVNAEASGGNECTGVMNSGGASPNMLFVSASATGGSQINKGIANISSWPFMMNITSAASGGQYNYGIHNSEGSTPIIQNVTSTASGGSEAYGIYNHSSAPSLNAVYAEGTGATSKACGMTNYSASSNYALSVDRSTLKGATNSLENNINFTLTIGLSKLDGAATAVGTWHCAGCFNGSYAALGGDCQPMP